MSAPVIEPRSERRAGRPSRHPVTVRYAEDTAVHAVMNDAAEKYGLTFSEVQRMVNRAGIEALKLAEA